MWKLCSQCDLMARGGLEEVVMIRATYESRPSAECQYPYQNVGRQFPVCPVSHPQVRKAYPMRKRFLQTSVFTLSHFTTVRNRGLWFKLSNLWFYDQDRNTDIFLPVIQYITDHDQPQWKKHVACLLIVYLFMWCACMCVLGTHMYVSTHPQAAVREAYCTPSCLSRLLPWDGVSCWAGRLLFCLGWLAKACLWPSVLGLQAHTQPCLVFYIDVKDIKSGSLVFRTRFLTHQVTSSSLQYVLTVSLRILVEVHEGSEHKIDFWKIITT